MGKFYVSDFIDIYINCQPDTEKYFFFRFQTFLDTKHFQTEIPTMGNRYLEFILVAQDYSLNLKYTSPNTISVTQARTMF